MSTGEHWYFTFAIAHPLKDKYVKVSGSYSSAREQMVAFFDRKWAFQYNEDEFIGKKQPERWGLVEITEEEILEWKRTQKAVVAVDILRMSFNIQLAKPLPLNDLMPLAEALAIEASKHPDVKLIDNVQMWEYEQPEADGSKCKKQLGLLAGVLHEILVESKSINNVYVNGAELLMHAKNYVEHLKEAESK